MFTLIIAMLFGSMQVDQQAADRAALREAIKKLQQNVDQQTDAIRARVEVHVQYEDCVKNKARELSVGQEQTETVADVAMRYCSSFQDQLRQRAYGQSDQTDWLAQKNQVDGWMAEWDRQIRIEAMSIVVAHRTGQTLPAR